jgi:hypothetical protein
MLPLQAMLHAPSFEFEFGVQGFAYGHGDEGHVMSYEVHAFVDRNVL